MNSIYEHQNQYQANREFYATPNNSVNNLSCYDNKAMVTTALSTRPVNEQVHVNITETDKQTSAAAGGNKPRSILHFRRKIPITWVINGAITVLVAVVIILLEFGFVPGHNQGFYCNDPIYSHKLQNDTISMIILIIGTLLLPLLILILVEYLRKGNFSNIRLREIWFLLKEHLIGVSMVLLVTEIAKILVGEHRPQFFAICVPDTNLNCVNGTFIESYKCTNTKLSRYIIGDASRSFPSGHSSVSVFTALFCSYIIQSRLPISKTGSLAKPFMISLCLTWALVCALTRITDRKHHWWDVLAGSVLGLGGAIYTLCLVHKKLAKDSTEFIKRVATSTTTLLDVKNKDAKSEII